MRVLEELNDVLLESAKYRVGTIVMYRSGSTKELGVVIGQDGRELLVVGASTPALAKTKDRTRLRDRAITTRLGTKMRFKGVQMDVQRVPSARTWKVGILTGRNVRMYQQLAALL